MSRIAPYPLRMAPEIRENLEKEAEKSKRSLQQEILFRLDKFQQIENLLASSLSDNEDVFMQVANALRMAKVSESRAEEIQNLKKRIESLMSSVKLTETDRFMTISSNIESIEVALKKIISVMPDGYIEEKNGVKKPT
ncbi:TraY domain-containing protein [Erwinia sp. AnSW2-5]|uniref:TraY domain-containing protein n=1 Tax=Erwinia sp. AnSW2-5 TaxID=3367692 RepID=UPI003858D33B